MTGSTISTSIAYGVTLGEAGYGSPLVITKTGSIEPRTNAATAVYSSAYATVSNFGFIRGGPVDQAGLSGGTGVYLRSSSYAKNFGSIHGGSTGYLGADGGVGAQLFLSSMMNYGLVEGGFANGRGAGGPGIVLEGGTATNSGTLEGGAGYAGGTGVVVEFGAFTNSAIILGGPGNGSIGGGGFVDAAGYASNDGTIFGGVGGLTSSGGFGIGLFGATSENAGVIVGGAGGELGGQGGYGATLQAGYLRNVGGITGGQGGDVVGLSYGNGGSGAEIMLGSLNNLGNVTGAMGINSGGIFESHGGDGIILRPAGLYQAGGEISNSGTITGGNGDAGGIGVYINTGTLITSGMISGGLNNNNIRQIAVDFRGSLDSFVVEPGATFIGGVVASGEQAIELANGPNDAIEGSLDMGGSFVGFDEVQFGSGSQWVLSGTVPELADVQVINGFAIGDTLNLEGFSAVFDVYVPGAGLELVSANTLVALDILGDFTTSSFTVQSSDGTTQIELTKPICYLAGTLVLTPAGEVPIEKLVIGDAVVTRFSGYRKIKWIGRQNFDRRSTQRDLDPIPVRIASGSLGPHLPTRDLYVSPGHSMLLDGILVLARDLINGINITQPERREDIHYFQLDLEGHDCLRAEGVWSESFCDYSDFRNHFHNVDEFWRLYPTHITPNEHMMCAPRPTEGPELASIFQRLSVKAASLSRPGPLQGWIDEVSENGAVRGWARDLENVDLPVLLEIFAGERLLGNVLACDSRADLLANGIGRGRCAFTFSGPRLSATSKPTISVRRAIDGANLPKAPHCLSDILIAA